MIGEALADDTTKQCVGAITVIAAERGAVAVAEIKFGKIAMQVLFSAVLIDAAHPALEYRKIALDGVAVNFRQALANIFAASV